MRFIRFSPPPPPDFSFPVIWAVSFNLRLSTCTRRRGPGRTWSALGCSRRGPGPGAGPSCASVLPLLHVTCRLPLTTTEVSLTHISVCCIFIMKNPYCLLFAAEPKRMRQLHFSSWTTFCFSYFRSPVKCFLILRCTGLGLSAHLCSLGSPEDSPPGALWPPLLPWGPWVFLCTTGRSLCPSPAPWTQVLFCLESLSNFGGAWPEKGAVAGR